MTKKRSAGGRKGAEGQPQKQRFLMLTGFAGIFLLSIVAFTMLREQSSNPGTGSASRSAELVVGAPAPDFTLVSNNGGEVSLSDYRGRPVAVTFMHTW